MKADEKLPCRRCGEPHVQRIAAGGGVTWQAADGHPYDRYQPENEPAPKGRHLTGVAVDEGFTGIFFGTFARCDTCSALVENKRADMANHRAWHDLGGGAA